MIVHFIDNLFPESGGPTAVVLGLARAQALLGFEVTVVSRLGAGLDGTRAIESAWVDTQVRYIDLSQRGLFAREFSHRSLLDETRPKLVHIHNVWESSLRRMAAACVSRGTPYVLSTHGMLHPSDLGRKWLKKAAYLALFGDVVRAAGEVLALNEEEAFHVRTALKTPSSVLLNGVGLDQAGTSPDAFLRRFPELVGRPYALFVGRIHRSKAVHRLVEAYAEARFLGMTQDLVVLGPPGGEERKLEATIHRLGLESCVHVVGPIFGSEKWAAITGCDLFVHRPLFEGFGIAIGEALACGKPVVTTTSCKLGRASDDGALLMVEDIDDRFSRAMHRIATDAHEAARLGQEGANWARKHLDWSAVAVSANDAYQRAARARARQT
jgi:glycosyltransferase involved in cell wall biosynthesis